MKFCQRDFHYSNQVVSTLITSVRVTWEERTYNFTWRTWAQSLSRATVPIRLCGKDTHILWLRQRGWDSKEEPSYHDCLGHDLENDVWSSSQCRRLIWVVLRRTTARERLKPPPTPESDKGSNNFVHGWPGSRRDTNSQNNFVPWDPGGGICTQQIALSGILPPRHGFKKDGVS